VTEAERPGTAAAPAAPVETDVERFWQVACHRAKLTTLPGYLPATSLELVTPPAWSFGRTPEQADALLALVLDGTKTATASAAEEYAAEGEPLPAVGDLGIVLDGSGCPRALLVTTEVRVVSFAEVDAEHARLEGEGDLSLAHWHRAHEAFFDAGPGFRADMPVVLERFTVLHQA